MKIQPKFLVAAGMFIFFLYSLWGYKILTPGTDSDDFFWMLIVRGVGMGMLFVPITTLSLSALRGREIGQGASFTGMMRQLGGSFGIALITTFMTRRNALHRSDLVGYINPSDPDVQQRLTGMQHMFEAKGMSPNTALESAYKLLDGSIMRQVAVLSYMDVFLYIGLLFLLCVPVILLIRFQKANALPPGEMTVSYTHLTLPTICSV